MDLPEQTRLGVNIWISALTDSSRERTDSLVRLPRVSRPRIKTRISSWFITLLSFRLPSQRETDALIRAAYQKEYQRLRDPRAELRFHD